MAFPSADLILCKWIPGFAHFSHLKGKCRFIDIGEIDAS